VARILVNIRTQGIVLLKREFREYDRIYTIYTSDYGKVEVLGRGTRKIISKLASHLEPPGLIDLLIIRGRIFDHVTGVKRLDEFSNIRTDFSRLFEFARMAAIFDREVKLEQKDPELYNLLNNFLQDLNSALPNFHHSFLHYLTQYVNYGIINQPRLDRP